MDRIWSLVLESSIYGSIVGLVIILFKAILKNKINRRWSYFLWILLFIKLIVPYGPESSFSIFNKIPVIINQGVDSNLNTHFNEINNNLDNDINSNTSTKVNNSTIQENLHIDNKLYEIDNIIPLIWLSIFLMLLSVFIVIYLLFGNQFKNNKVHNVRMNSLLNKSKVKMKIKSNIDVIISDKIRTPSLYRVIKPEILFPSSMLDLDDDEIEYILLHELSHYKRKDILVNYLMIFLQCIHWFNPFIWYLFKIIKEDMELATDEMVVSILDFRKHKDYANTIITIIERVSIIPKNIVSLGMADDKKILKKRIKMIKNASMFKNKKNTIVLIGICCFIILGGTLLTSKSNDKEVFSDNVEVSLKLDEAITNAIKEFNIDKYSQGEFNSEAHVVLGKKEKNNNIDIYALVNYGSFMFENDIFTLVSGGWGIPTKITFEIDENHNYNLLEYKEAYDGGLYEASIRKMFPKNIVTKVMNSDSYEEKLLKEQKLQAEKYLKSINRKANVSMDNSNLEDKKENFDNYISEEAQNKLFSVKELYKFPTWIGKIENVVDGIRYIYETNITKDSDGYYIIKYKRYDENKNIIEEHYWKVYDDDIKEINHTIYK